MAPESSADAAGSPLVSDASTGGGSWAGFWFGTPSLGVLDEPNADATAPRHPVPRRPNEEKQTPPSARERWARTWPSLLAVVTLSAVGGPAAVASYRHARNVIAQQRHLGGRSELWAPAVRSPNRLMSTVVAVVIFTDLEASARPALMAYRVVEQQIVCYIEITAQDRPNPQEVTYCRDVVHADDLTACIQAMTEGGKRAGQPLARGPAGDRSHEVLPRNCNQQRPA
jgi:hypothetical protein